MGRFAGDREAHGGAAEPDGVFAGDIEDEVAAFGEEAVEVGAAGGEPLDRASGSGQLCFGAEHRHDPVVGRTDGEEPRLLPRFAEDQGVDCSSWGVARPAATSRAVSAKRRPSPCAGLPRTVPGIGGAGSQS